MGFLHTVRFFVRNILVVASGLKAVQRIKHAAQRENLPGLLSIPYQHYSQWINLKEYICGVQILRYTEKQQNVNNKTVSQI